LTGVDETARPWSARPMISPHGRFGLQAYDRPLCGPPHLPQGVFRFLKSGDSVLNVATGKKERIGRLLKMHANNREEISEVYSGDIVAAVGLKKTSTGDSLCDLNAPVELESLHVPEPVVSVAIQPESKPMVEKLGMALQRLAAEDPASGSLRKKRPTRP
jgi:predicted membrane GTPase involved in stress response